MRSIVGSQICKEDGHSNLEIRKLFLKHQQTPWPESASKLCRPSERRLLVRLVRAFADGGCHVVSVTDPCYRVLGFLDRSCCFFFQVAPQLYSRGWVGPVPDPLPLGRCGGAGSRARGLWPLDRRHQRH
jgi:hypothetical protein